MQCLLPTPSSTSSLRDRSPARTGRDGRSLRGDRPALRQHGCAQADTRQRRAAQQGVRARGAAAQQPPPPGAPRRHRLLLRSRRPVPRDAVHPRRRPGDAARRGAAVSGRRGAAWAGQLLDALDYLHSQSRPSSTATSSHRTSSSPPRGDIILLDFGLAKGAITGMPLARGRASSAIRRSTRRSSRSRHRDGHAQRPVRVAATLYHLLTNATPVDALTRVAASVRREPDPLRPPHELNAAISLLQCGRACPTRASRRHPHLRRSPTLSQPTATMLSPTGRIAFITNCDGNQEIYAIDAKSGVGLANLSNNPANDYEPAWSPHDWRIAFSSNCDGNPEIYVMNADGTSQKRLTRDPNIDGGPAWSPGMARGSPSARAVAANSRSTSCTLTGQTQCALAPQVTTEMTQTRPGRRTARTLPLSPHVTLARAALRFT